LKKANLIFLSAFITVGVLFVAAVVIPNFLSYNARAYQTGAKRNLESIYAAEIRYKSEHGTYAEKFIPLKWKANQNYSYKFYLSDNEFYPDDTVKLPHYFRPYANKDSFSIFAVTCSYQEKPGGKLKYDIWCIDEKGNLKNIVNEWY